MTQAIKKVVVGGGGTPGQVEFSSHNTNLLCQVQQGRRADWLADGPATFTSCDYWGNPLTLSRP